MASAGSTFTEITGARSDFPAPTPASIVSALYVSPQPCTFADQQFFSELDLPEYESYDSLRSHLYTAMTAGSDYFGFA